MPDDHSKVVPLLPIPNRKVKRLSADDSADSRVKVGHRQASIMEKPSVKTEGFFSSRERVLLDFATLWGMFKHCVLSVATSSGLFGRGAWLWRPSI